MKSKISKRRPKRAVENFLNNWTPDMAYILGYFASDGTMFRNKRGSYYMAFTSTDEELIRQVKQIMRVSNKIEVYQIKSKAKLRYNIQIGSHKLFSQLLNLGFTPNKSLSLKLPKNIPNLLMGHFLRGYFDGDGNAYYSHSKRKNRPGYVNYLIINLRSGSKIFLEPLQKQLTQLLGIRGSLYRHSGAFSLAYSGGDVVKLYSFLYPDIRVPHLERKRVILEAGIKNMGSKCNGLHDSLSRSR